MKYNHSEVEKRWQKYWSSKNLFATNAQPKKKFYTLEMFAYPSGDLHLGHLKNYVIGDVYARFKRRTGYDVLHPVGWDAFGLPAENRAIQLGVHPEKSTLDNIKISADSFKLLGINCDWEREIITCLPDYYRWTQWMFLLLYKRGLAYRKQAYVNWCTGCQTVLANEQVTEGRCYRCDSSIQKRKLNQWFFKITDYAERLFTGLDKLDGWKENVKTIQRHWIGKSEGCDILFKIAEKDIIFSVFTTRPDTLYGVTFMSLAPEHPFIDDLIQDADNEQEVRTYIEKALARSDIERSEKEKDGVFLGYHAVNPATGEKIPLFVADYVLLEYGSGVVMGVPAHDQRDFEFAKKYNLPIRVVIDPPDAQLDPDTMTQAYVDPGIMVNSDRFNGMNSAEGIAAVTQHLAKTGLGGPSINYRLKDWLISRQRYWGAPIPIIYCSQCGSVPVPEKDLPVLLPQDITDFVPKGKSPLAAVESYINTTCPECGKPAKRDPDTMDTFVCSSWYFLRYPDPHNDRIFCAREAADTWLPIDQYIGGTSEHATGHLIYFRFLTKVLYDAGYISVDEPTRNLFNLGMLMKDGEKMSSSKGNLVPVRDFINKHGADVARLTILAAAPPERESEWTTEGVVGAERFMDRVYRLISENASVAASKVPSTYDHKQEALMIKIHQTIAKVTGDLDTFKFNTAIAALWELLNDLYTCTLHDEVFGFGIYTLIQLLSPFAPHLADELWSQVGGEGSLTNRTWPEYSDKYLKDKITTIVIQINGKVRSHLHIEGPATQQKIEELAYQDEKIKRHLAGKKTVKKIYVPEKLLNIVVR
ncbi:MAG: leucine--tRNA ligase [candidate division WOR-3 bacterium]|nr:MAG: leucine--tRNA ligase [candidate division WOR-3 bacterium]